MKFNINKKDIIDTSILYAITLSITLAMVYLLFPNLLTGLSEVKRVNANVAVVDEKIDSMSLGNDYLHEKVDIITINQYDFTSTILDSLYMLSRKIDNIQRAVYQSNRLLNQNTNDLQTIKQLNVENSLTDTKRVQYSPKSATSSLDSLFFKK